jgi:hypothetical protein
MPDSDAPEISYEARAVFFKRYKEAREAGLTIVEARLWADSDRDVGELRKLVRTQCPAELLVRIVI